MGAWKLNIKLPWEHPDFIDTLRGVLFRGPQYEDKAGNLPTPGAQATAYESYAMAAFTPIGPATHAISRRMVPFPNKPLYTSPATVVAGIPRIAGQYVLQPLLNPYAPETIQNPPQLFG